MVWDPYEVGQSSCVHIRNTVQHTIERDHPRRSSMLSSLGSASSVFDICTCADQLREQFLFYPDRFCY